MQGLGRASSMGVGGGADGILILLAEDLNHSLETRLIAQLHVRQPRVAELAPEFFEHVRLATFDRLVEDEVLSLISDAYAI